jgi:hypothetical protein
MPTGTLCISKLSAKFETYCATFVPYDATLPGSVTLHGVDRLQSFLEAAGITPSDRTLAIRDTMTFGVAVLGDVEITVQTLGARAA